MYRCNGVHTSTSTRIVHFPPGSVIREYGEFHPQRRACCGLALGYIGRDYKLPLIEPGAIDARAEHVKCANISTLFLLLPDSHAGRCTGRRHESGETAKRYAGEDVNRGNRKRKLHCARTLVARKNATNTTRQPVPVTIAVRAAHTPTTALRMENRLPPWFVITGLVEPLEGGCWK